MTETHQTLLNGKPLSDYDKDGLELKSKKSWKKGRFVFAIVYVVILIVTYWMMPRLTYVQDDILQYQCEARILHESQSEDVSLIRDNLENWREIGSFREFYSNDSYHHYDFRRSGNRVNYSVYVSMGEMYERFNNLGASTEPEELDFLQKLIRRNTPYTDSELLDSIFVPFQAEALQAILNNLEEDQFAVGVQFTFSWIAEGDNGTDLCYDFAINDQGLSFSEAAKFLQIITYAIIALGSLLILAMIAATIKFVNYMKNELSMEEDDDEYFRDDEDEEEDD